MNPPTTSASDKLSYDARSVDDMARLHFKMIENNPAAWIVLRLHPEPHSGSATVAGKVMDGTTGELIDGPVSAGARTGQTVIVLEGSWEWIASVTGGTPAAIRGEYSWMEAPKLHLHQLTASDLYSPYAKGGVVLCRYDPREEPQSQFDPVFLLPANWYRSVRPGYEWFEGYRGLFQVAPASDQALAPIVLGGNPILSVMAFRLLAEAGNVSPQLFGAASRHGDFYLHAIVIYILLIDDASLRDTRLAVELDHHFESPATSEDLRAASLAIYARMMLNQVAAPAGERERRLLQVLRSHGAASDPYLREILRVLGG